jgi:hypothetical protein
MSLTLQALTNSILVWSVSQFEPSLTFANKAISLTLKAITNSIGWPLSVTFTKA